MRRGMGGSMAGYCLELLLQNTELRGHWALSKDWGMGVEEDGPQPPVYGNYLLHAPPSSWLCLETTKPLKLGGILDKLMISCHRTACLCLWAAPHHWWLRKQIQGLRINIVLSAGAVTDYLHIHTHTHTKHTQAYTTHRLTAALGKEEKVTGEI